VDIRYVLIRYEVEDATYVGSGFLVSDRAVLTADHVATGTGHRVVYEGREFPVDESVRSGTKDVDLAVLSLRDSVSALDPMPFALVDRGRGGKLTECWAVGYPKRSKDSKGRVSRQVNGFIRPADGVHASGRADGAWLTLVGEEASWSDALPGEISSGDSGDIGTGNPWGGMSGAAVIKNNMIIGVVCRHYQDKGSETLTITPLTALKLLPGDRQERFREALGLGHLDDLPTVTEDGAQLKPEHLVAPAPGAHHTEPVAFSPDIRDRYQEMIEAAGLPVPDRWDEAALLHLCHTHRGHDATAVALEALCLGIQALPLFTEIGGTDIAMKTLRHLYHWHVGRWPDARTSHGMLVEAASATIREWRAFDSGYSPERLTVLARFMLAVAGRRKAAALVSLDDPGLRPLVDWLRGPLTQQSEDVEDYLAKVCDGRTWALIELVAEESAERTQPTGVVVDLISERGERQTSRIPCVTAQGVTAEESVKDALRQAIAGLPDDGVLVDLCLPRHWLDAGVERWEVVEVGGRYENIGKHYDFRLRWAMHRHEVKLRNRQVKRFRAVDWAAQPEAIPQSVTSDPEQLRDWLGRRDVKGVRLPPYLSAVQPASGEHDPLRTLLWEGYGLAVWFGPDAEAGACASAVCLAEGVAAAERLEELPAMLAAELRDDRPVIIWNDPEGRADFKLPDPRGGTRRGSID
jgi:Trypsin